MRHVHGTFILAATLCMLARGSLAASDAPVLLVSVSPSGERCKVLDRNVNCVHVGKLLHDELAVSFTTPVAVAAEGTGGEGALFRSRHVAAAIKAAGYTRVGIVGSKETGPQ